MSKSTATTSAASSAFPIKIVMCGDGEVGKTSLIMTYAMDKFPDTFVPTVLDTYDTNQLIADTPRNLRIIDTSGQEDYKRLRPLSYPNTDVFILTFSIDRPESLTNILLKWYPEVTEHCPSVPIILAANKIDLRTDCECINELAKRHMSPVTCKQGKAMARRIKAKNYFECSAYKREGVKTLFVEAVMATLHQNDGQNKNGICQIF